MAWTEYNSLNERIRTILGANVIVSPRVTEVTFFTNYVVVMLRIDFRKDELVPNLKKRSKDTLLFSVGCSSYTLELNETNLGLGTNNLICLRENMIQFQLRRYDYKIETEQLHYFDFKTENSKTCC